MQRVKVELIVQLRGKMLILLSVLDNFLVDHFLAVHISLALIACNLAQDPV
jgi:hypothetical protein